MKGVVQLLFIVSLISASSDDPSSDNPTAPAGDGKATFSMRLSSSTGSTSKSTSSFATFDTIFFVTDLSGTEFSIKEARMGVRHIQSDFTDGASDTLPEDKISTDGPFVINLMTGESTPDRGEFTIEPGLYKRIDVRLDDSKASDGLVDSNDALFENTLVITGNFD